MQHVAYVAGARAAALALGAMGNTVLALQRLHADLGPTVVVTPPSLNRRRRRQVVFTADALAIRAVLQDAATFHNVALYPVRGPADSSQRRLRGGIIRMNGVAHDHARATVAPFLTRARARTLEPRIAAIAREEVAAWPLGGRADLVVLVQRLIRRIALETLFGEPDPEAILAMSEFGARHLEHSHDMLALAAPLDLPFTPYGRVLSGARRVETMLTAWLARRRPGPRGLDLMSMMLDATDEAGRPLSDGDAAAQLWTLYGATFDTTTSTLTWLLLLLAQHPAEAARLLAELNAAPDGETPAFMGQAIKEAMRVCTPVPLQIRKASADTVLPRTEVAMAAGDHVILADCVANRDPRWFPDALAFRPDRWSDPSLPDASILTFSAGPRGCLGYWFAVAVLSAAVGAIWPRVRLAVPDGAKIDFHTLITMSPRAVPVRLLAQDGRFAAARITGQARRMAPALDGPAPAPRPASRPAGVLVEEPAG